MSFSITTTREFSAAHQLKLYDGSMEPLHGHNWKVSVTVASPLVDAIGVVMDFHELERLADAIIGTLHNRHLNDVEAFRSMNPSAENVAMLVGQSLAPRLPKNVTLTSVEVWETVTNSALYRP